MRAKDWTSAAADVAERFGRAYAQAVRCDVRLAGAIRLAKAPYPSGRAKGSATYRQGIACEGLCGPSQRS